MDLHGKNILIAGAGVSGVGAAGLLGQAGYAAAIYDGNEKLDVEAVKAKLPDGMDVCFELGEFQDVLAERYDILVLSPGISIHKPIAQAFSERGKPVIGEIELASIFSKGKVAAITGTNGKTTTTALTGQILRQYYEKVFVVGNIGIPYTSIALDTTDDCAIAAEISSFQLETTVEFRPHVSAVLNLTPDHLDRHGTMECYGQTKLSISKNQTKEDVILLNHDDVLTRQMAERTSARPVMFSRLSDLSEGIVLSGDTFLIREKGKEIPVCTLRDINLLGGHNHENILAAIGITYYMGVPVEDIKKGIRSFHAVEHRIEFVDTVDGVDYYNDSKGTNPDAAIKGIQAMVKPTVLLGGGYDKGSTYDEWIEAFDGKVKCLILMGVTAEKIRECALAHGFDRIIMVETFEEAMRAAREQAEPGDAVLLSPACASWGMFKNYEVRGEVFKDIVRQFKR